MKKKNHLNNLIKIIFIYISMGVFISGCSNSGVDSENLDEVVSEDVSAVEVDNGESYPGYPSIKNDSIIEEGGYPPLVTVAPPSIANPYPGPIDENAVLLALDKPIRPGDTNISGVGPVGLIVELINTTNMGETLGTTSINEDGTFTLQVNPLPENVRLGLRSDISTLGLVEADIRPGDESRNIPLVGFFFDTVLVIER